MIDSNDLSSFNEVEDGTVLRTLVDWKLFNKDNEMVSLDELGEGKPLCSVTGYLIKPLSKEAKAKVTDNISTFGILSDDGPEPTVVQERLVKEKLVVEWDSIAVGDTLDGYCDKTFKWMKARVVDIIRESEPVRFKVHFNGWKAKHDEWLDAGSARLAALGQHTEVVMVDVVKPPQIPWYENSAILSLIEGDDIDEPGSEERREVTITDIEDWCVDYAYANPSLWLVSREGPWYRVVSPLIPGGGSGHPIYQPLFDAYLEKFVAAAHCAYCLIDFLPLNRKLSFQNVVDEVDSRSGGRVDDITLLVHAPFIIDQLSSLSAPDGATDKEIPVADSHFMTQYKKRADQYTNLKNEKKRKRRVVCKSLMNKSRGGTIDFSGRDGRGRAKKDEPLPPMRDHDYWIMQEQAGHPSLPRPRPLSSGQLLPADLAHLLGDVLEAWAVLSNYKELLSLPDVSIETLLGALLGEEREEDGARLLQEVHLQLLLPLLLHTGPVGEGGSPSYSCSYSNASRQENGRNAKDSPNSLILWDSIQDCCQMSSDPLDLLKHFLRQGDMWVEVIRVLLRDRGEVDVPEYVDTVLVLQSIVEDLLASPSYQALLSTEQPLSGSITSSQDRFPKDLNDVVNAIKCGFYESGIVKLEPRGKAPSDALLLPNYQLCLEAGSNVDAYSSVLQAWCSAKVAELGEGRVLLVRFPAWGSGFDETVEKKCLAPHKSLSCGVHKDTHPDLIPPSVLSDLEASCRKEFMKTATHPPEYVPHEAIAADVKVILSQIIEASSTSNGGEILEEFCQAYLSKVVDASSTKKITADLSGEPDLQMEAHHLGKNSYQVIPPVMKIKLLCWLCEEVVGSPGAKSYLEGIMDQKLAIEKALRMGSKSKQEDTDDPATEKGVRSGKRRASEMLEEGGNGGGDEEERVSSVGPVDSATLAAFDYRILPLGKDRNDNVYWAFRKDCVTLTPSPRIFCEDRVSRQWTVFSDESDVQLLLSWLSEYGINETSLKQKIKTLWGSLSPAERTDPISSLSSSAPPMHVRYVDVLLGPEGRLEAGVKDLDGRVVVSTFKYNDRNCSCAQDAGLLICDQLISLNGHPIFDISSLQNAMTAVKQSHAESSDELKGAKLSFLVLRYSSPEQAVPAIHIALSTDAEFKTHYEQQGSEIDARSPPPDEVVVCDKLVGLLVEMLYSTSAVYPSSSRYVFLGFRHFVTKLCDILHSSRCKLLSQSVSEKKDQSKTLVSGLQDCLLDIEFALSHSGRGLLSTWEKGRRRFKWVQCCQAAISVSQVSFCAFCLYQGIDWVELAEIGCIIDQSKTLQYVPAEAQCSIPQPGQRVLFFGDSYSSCENLNPIAECSDDIPAVRVACNVQSVKHYKGGGDGSGDKERVSYMKLVLETAEEEQPPPLRPLAAAPPGDTNKLNRLLNMLISRVLALPEAVPFSSPVSVKDCPNYYDIITSPMHLGEIQEKILENAYSTTAEFLADMSLIRSNCVLYCAEPYPSLLPLVEIVHATALDFTRRLFPDTEPVPYAVQPRVGHSLPEVEAGLTFTLCVPLNATKFDSFIVGMEKYRQSADLNLQVEDSFHVQHSVVANGESHAVRQGIIVGGGAASSSPSLFAPWRCVKVQWKDEVSGGGLCDSVNPWEIVLSKK